MWKGFIPLVYSIDGIAEKEAKNVVKHLTYHLSVKYHKPISHVVYYVWVQIVIAMVHANNLLTYFSRDQQHPPCPVIFNRHTMKH
jgi:hypothetical protein